ncbi:calcium-binding protein [Phenylobacterium sp.]|uniref:calcium-binding protein n=1 Tax=Phenylobacterium sp. TaxID=1871053 RepID=UPI0025E637E4|nr:calcium-binding protein [Phenylobacterium sp.]
MTIVAAAAELNFDEIYLGALGERVITNYTSGFAQAEGGGVIDRYYGDFIFNGDGALVGGTLTQYMQIVQGVLSLHIYNVSVPIVDLAFGILNDVTLGELQIFNGADLMTGSAFNDLIRSQGGADQVYGGMGADTVFAGLGNDSIWGGEGRSFLRGEDGDDSLTGGSDFDDLHGNMGDDTLRGGAGSDWVVGGKDQDELHGDAGADVVYGNLGSDVCYGDDGNDLVRGGQNDDVIYGGAGDDWLSGDRHSDTISGGSGADVFHTFGDAGIDRVLDFNRAEGDRVQVDPGTVYTFSQVGGDVVISMQGGAQMVLVGVSTASLTGDWIFAA